ncbi:helix-turn-helix domain-containing protein [Leucobacter salsicius]|uniref:helix-turn-helix domain-containing protein n=1 Tax=Leucobacter salsicius TaxID=664638 RepID=UPI00034D1C99|nr:helix-turn-helix domain-containing protein [Leucobacter salsicius]
MIQEERTPEGWMTVSAASEALGVHERTVQRRIKAGEIPVFELSPHRRLVPEGWVNALLEGRLKELGEY